MERQKAWRRDTESARGEQERLERGAGSEEEAKE